MIVPNSTHYSGRVWRSARGNTKIRESKYPGVYPTQDTLGICLRVSVEVSTPVHVVCASCSHRLFASFFSAWMHALFFRSVIFTCKPCCSGRLFLMLIGHPIHLFPVYFSTGPSRARDESPSRIGIMFTSETTENVANSLNGSTLAVEGLHPWLVGGSGP